MLGRRASIIPLQQIFYMVNLRYKHTIFAKIKNFKKGKTFSRLPFLSPSLNISALLLFLPHLGEALTAIYRAIGLGLKRNLCLTAAAGTGGGKILPRTTSRSFASVTAGLAALRLILEATLRIKLLLTGGEHELLAALFAYKRLVFVHDITLSLFLAQVPDMDSERCWDGLILRSAYADVAGNKEGRSLAPNALDSIVHRF